MSNIDKQSLRNSAERTINILENIAGFEPSDIDGDTVELRFETEDGFDTGCDVSIVDQCQKAADVVQALLDELEAAEKRCAALAAENAGLKKFCKDAAFDADYEAELGMERGGFADALNDIKTPATDAFLAEVRASGVEMLAEHLSGMNISASETSVRDFAAQLRKGVI